MSREPWSRRFSELSTRKIVSQDGLLVWLRVCSVGEVLQTCMATFHRLLCFSVISGVISMSGSLSGMQKSYSWGNVKIQFWCVLFLRPMLLKQNKTLFDRYTFFLNVPGLRFLSVVYAADVCADLWRTVTALRGLALGLSTLALLSVFKMMQVLCTFQSFELGQKQEKQISKIHKVTSATKCCWLNPVRRFGEVWSHIQGQVDMFPNFPTTIP